MKERPHTTKKTKRINYEILFEDEHHLVVNKPAGMGCIPDRRDMGRACLLDLLKVQYPTASFVHRLDVETSGIVLVALHKDALRWFSLQFQERTISKEYITYVKGFVPFTELSVSRPVGPILRKGETTVRRKGKDSVTRFVKDRDFRKFSKLLCHPETGRTHQIRIHLSDMGLPIVGDLKYRGEYPLLSQIKKKYQKSSRYEGRDEPLLLDRVALHAHKLEYCMYEQEERVVRTCPEAGDMLNFCKKLDKYS